MKKQKLMFFFAITISVIAFWDLVFLKKLKLLIVLFHEIFHALASLATGGIVKQIFLHSKEAGETIIQGNGISFLFVVSAGYVGTSIFGGYLLLVGFEKKLAKLNLILISLILIFTTTTFTESNSLAYKIGIQSGVLFLFMGIVSKEISSLILIFLGTSFSLYSIYDLSDFTEQVLSSDAGILAKWLIQNRKTFLGMNLEQLAYSIALFWTLVSLVFVIQLLKKTFKEDDPFKNMNEIQKQFASSNVNPEVAKWFLERGLDLNGKPLKKNWAVEINKERNSNG